MAERDDDLSLRSTGTLALWLSCLIVSVAGLATSRELPPAQLAVKSTKVKSAESTIDVVTIPKPAIESQSPDDPPRPSAELTSRVETPQPRAADIPALPQSKTLSEPPAFVALHKPAAPPARPIAPAATTRGTMPARSEAAASGQSPPAAARSAVDAAAVSQLVYGQGEGKQPPPVYPRESQLGRQEGTVVIRFEVDTRGNVSSAAVMTRCPWPLLNQAALRAVKETWHFDPGALKTFEVAIRFQLGRG